MYIIRILSRAEEKKGMLSLKESFGDHIFFKSVDYNSARGEVDLTPLIEQAAEFDSPASAFKQIKEVNTTFPIRGDGKPNRPLTAFNLIVESRKEAQDILDKSFNKTSFKDFWGFK